MTLLFAGLSISLCSCVHRAQAKLPPQSARLSDLWSSPAEYGAQGGSRGKGYVGKRGHVVATLAHPPRPTLRSRLAARRASLADRRAELAARYTGGPGLIRPVSAEAFAAGGGWPWNVPPPDLRAGPGRVEQGSVQRMPADAGPRTPPSPRDEAEEGANMKQDPWFAEEKREPAPAKDKTPELPRGVMSMPAPEEKASAKSESRTKPPEPPAKPKPKPESPAKLKPEPSKGKSESAAKDKPKGGSEYDHLPLATPVPGKPGYVTLGGKHSDLPEIDVRGIAPGTAVEIPDPKKPGATIQFRLP